MHRAPSLLAPPLRTEDGLAIDAPDPARRGRVLRNPFLRLVVVVVLIGIAIVAGSALGKDMLTEGAIRVVGVCVAYLVLAWLIEGRRGLVELGPRRIAGLPVGLALGTALFLVSFGTIAALGGVRFDGIDTGFDPWMVVFGLGVVAGITEELLFRGVLFRLVEELVGTWGALAVSGSVFGFVHIQNPDASWWGALAIALEAGLMFGMLYVVTRSLWVCIGTHAAWNIVQGAVFGVAVSGTGDPGGFIQTSPAGPDWLSGGRFGVEASYVTVVLLVAFTIWLAVIAVRRSLIVAPWWVRRRRPPGPRDAQRSGGRTLDERGEEGLLESA